MVLGVKIKNRETGLFRLKDGRFSKNGKTYSTLAFAKTAVTNGIGWLSIDSKLLNCDFIIFNDDGKIEIIPVKNHIIDYFNRMLKDYEKTINYYKVKNYDYDYLIKKINHIKQILNDLEKEGE